MGDPMTTYPGVGEPMSAGVLADGSTISHLAEHGRTVKVWENALHHGAHGVATDATVIAQTAHDDTVALQAGLTAAAGGTFYIPKGGYMVTASLVVPSGTTVRGAGPGSDSSGQGSWIYPGNIATTAPVFRVAAGSSGVQIRDLLIGQNTGEAILLDGNSGSPITHTIIENIWFNSGDATHFGIKAVWALETYIAHCHSFGARGGGVYLGDTCNASVIRDNSFSNHGTGALGGILVEANGCLIEGNVIEAWRGAYGIKVNAASGTNVIRNWFEDNNGIMIWVTGLSHATTVLGNNTAANGSTTYGLKADSCRYIYIANNEFAGGSVANMALTSTATVNQQTNAVLNSNYLGGSLDITGLLNTEDSVIRIGDRHDVVTPPVIEVLVGVVQFGTDVNLYRGTKANELVTDDAFKTFSAAHGGLPAPSLFDVGAQVYCTSDKKPVWSDGSAHWVDAAGANHT